MDFYLLKAVYEFSCQVSLFLEGSIPDGVLPYIGYIRYVLL